jgi:tRNA(Arg) A34 adenosine deaminase TadA
MTTHEAYLAEAIRLARENVEAGGRPFGAVIVRDGEVIATGVNHTNATQDPTAHAELVAIRAASARLGSPDLAGATVYASGHPCPMCLAAMVMGGIEQAYYAYSNEDGAPYGLTAAPAYAAMAGGPGAVDMNYLPVRPEVEPDLYDLWRDRNPAR